MAFCCKSTASEEKGTRSSHFLSLWQVLSGAQNEHLYSKFKGGHFNQNKKEKPAKRHRNAKPLAFSFM
jgi:hypothetical protein